MSARGGTCVIDVLRHVYGTSKTSVPLRWLNRVLPQQNAPVIQTTAININSPNAATSPGNSTSHDTVVVGPTPRDTAVRMTCPLCRVTCVTNLTHRNGALVWVLVGALAVVGCWPFCLIPFCVDGCKDVEHRCPSCQNVIHVHKRM
ncbi:Lipopolysaccharide-induced tumor necrosis factor-alpha factor [Merluccius polli]|uniref:Lipopolysaccharide-induced tumor necrosis factor-alpha factor n=1 Tax=Merluccius polli TaxID=89951 RepID=A0AA47N5H4_MERPO|nr:Lipopolysaccharide-induced tumor necrosis factor-alpha factor [Merluccius polli]